MGVGDVGDVAADGVVEHERPDEAQNELEVLVDDILRADVLERDGLGLHELEEQEVVVDHLDAHARPAGHAADGLLREYLQQRVQHQAILQADLEVTDLEGPLRKGVVGPPKECLVLQRLPF